MGNNNFDNPQTRQNISSIMNTPVPTITLRQIKKRTKKPRENRTSELLSSSRVLESRMSRMSEQFKPDLDGFQVRKFFSLSLHGWNFKFIYSQLHGSSLHVETETKVRPLASHNIQNSEELSKVCLP